MNPRKRLIATAIAMEIALQERETNGSAIAQIGPADLPDTNSVELLLAASELADHFKVTAIEFTRADG